MTDHPDSVEPCPFCGSADLTFGWVEGWESIGCSECHVRIESPEPGAVKAAWNRRTQLAAERERYAKLEAEAKRQISNLEEATIADLDKIAKLEAENARLRRFAGLDPGRIEAIEGAEVTEPTPKPTDALEHMKRLAADSGWPFDGVTSEVAESWIAAWEKERATLNEVGELFNEAQVRIRKTELALEEIEGEIQSQCDARYTDCKYECGASTNDLQAWADALRALREGETK